LETDGDDDTVDRLARPVLLKQVEKREPAVLVRGRIGVLCRVAAGGVDEDRVLGEPPVAIAGAADAGDGGRRRAPRERELETGIDERRGLAGARRTDEEIPRQVVEIIGLAAAGRL